MASKRLARSSVNWVEIYQKTAPHQQEHVRTLKTKSDAYETKVNSLPDKLPAIDWERYSKIVPIPGLVEKFKKEFEAAQVAYPKDTANWKAKVDEEEQSGKALAKRHLAACDRIKNSSQQMMDSLGLLPKIEEMSYEVAKAFFPQSVPSPDAEYFKNKEREVHHD